MSSGPGLSLSFEECQQYNRFYISFWLEWL
jgi:hypothetical protein